MNRILQDDPTPRDQRAAMIRVFGGTALAFVALMAIAIFMWPEVMQQALSTVMAMMR